MSDFLPTLPSIAWLAWPLDVHVDLKLDADLTGIATLALAAVTAWLAWTTRRVARTSGDQVKIDREQVEQSHRPVVVPYHNPVDEVRHRRGVLVSAAPNLDGGGILIPIQNVGTGPALKISAWFVDGLTDGRVEQPVEALAAGDKNCLYFTHPERAFVHNDLAFFKAQVWYLDVAGKQYETEITWNVGAFNARLGDA